ncbi:MAG: acyltransferase [Pseudomonadota bacterium]
MRTISEYLHTKDNNFQLIRFGAATGVFVSHCFSLAGFGATGKPALLGFISLNVFFVISGFLVTKSYLDRKNIGDYVRARVLRVYPALIIAVLFSTYFVGTAFSQLYPIDFLANPLVHLYALKNAILVWPDIPEELPGVFLDSNHSPTVNAPLWSLPYEIWCYALLAVFGCMFRAKISPRWFFIFIGAAFFVFFSTFVFNYAGRTDEYAIILGKDAFRLGAMFMLGVLMYGLNRHIPVSIWVAVIVVIGIAAAGLTSRLLFTAAFYGALGYLVLYFAYGIRGPVLAFNKLGDYSYGIYIFGYPIQQGLEQVVPNLSLPAFFAISFSITVLLAIASWHIVERKALTLKRGPTVNPG